MQQFIFVLCLLAATTASAQSYVVIDLRGEVKADGKLLQKKSKIDPDTQLEFSSQSDEVHVYSPKGKQLITPVNLQPNSKNEFWSAVKNAILPPEQYKSTSIRDTSTNLVFADIFDLMAYFREKVLVIDTTSFRIDSDKFTTDEEHYFEIRYERDGQEYREKLAGENTTFHLITIDLFSEVEAFDPEGEAVALFYMDGKKPNGTPIGEFTLVPGNQDEIIASLEVLLEQSGKTGLTFLMEEALPFLEQRYGKANPQQIRSILSKF